MAVCARTLRWAPWLLVVLSLALPTNAAADDTRPGTSATEQSVDPKRVHVMLLNGGAKPRANYKSHFEHLQEMRAALDGRGVPLGNITVFNADGEARGKDMASREVVALPDKFWLLDGTPVGRRLKPETVLENTRWNGVKMRPASKKAIRRWLTRASRELVAGDVLLVYVTDHGGKGRRDLDNGDIHLWEEKLSVVELRDMLGRLNRDVRVVMLMSQCFSGTFAASIYPDPDTDRLPTGNQCGYFSTTRDRFAYGCYPEGRAQQRLGHAFTLIDALSVERDLSAAHDRVSLRDASPDVPLRTSDVFVERLLEKEAQAQEKPLAELADQLLATTWNERDTWASDLAVLDRLGQAYGLLSPRYVAEADAIIEAMNELLTELEGVVKRWRDSFRELQQANVNRLLDGPVGKRKNWRRKLDRERLDKLSDREKKQLTIELVEDLVASSRSLKGRWEELSTLHQQSEAMAAARYRMEVRVAVVMRMRARLVQIAGRALVADKNRRAAEGKVLEGLLACEATSVGTPAQPPDGEIAIPEMPLLADELHNINKLRPSYLGIRYAPIPRGERERFTSRHAGLELTPGAVTVERVEDASPARRAGLAVGDIVLGSDTVDFADRNAIRRFVMTAAKDEPIGLRVVRDGKPIKLSIKLGAWPMRDLGIAVSSRVGDRTPTLKSLVPAGSDKPLDLTGKRHLLVFWQTGCRPCTDALSAATNWARGRDVVVVAVSEDPDQDQLKELRRRTDRVFATRVVDAERQAIRKHGINASPTLILVEKNGVIAKRTSYQGGQLDL